MTNKEKVQKLVEHVVSMDYGESLMHHDIEEIVREKYKTNRYANIIRLSQDRLLALGKMLESVHGIGYRIVNPDDYTVNAVRQVNIGARRIKKGATIMEHAPTRQMSKEGLQAYNAVNDHMRILNAFVVGSNVEMKMIEGKRKHPLNIEEKKSEQMTMEDGSP